MAGGLKKVSGGYSTVTPFLLLASWILFLFLAFPYSSLNADVVNFGFLGNDLIKYGYLPTIPYGQSYLFSLTPYVYAALRLALPLSLPDEWVLKFAGTLFLLAGFVMLYSGFIVSVKTRGGDVVKAGAVFCLLIALFPTHLFDLFESSSIEMSILALGGIALLASLSERELEAGRAPGFLVIAAFSATLFFAFISRPQAAVYGIVAALVIIVRILWVSGIKRAAFTIIAAGLGGVIGYMPMILHNIFRAPKWPFTLHTELRLSTAEDFWNRVDLFRVKIFPAIFDLAWEQPLFSATAILYAFAAIGFFIWRAKSGKGVSLMSAAFVTGTLIVIIAMLMIPGLSWQSGHRRYALHTFICVAWLFAFSFAFAGIPRRIATGVLALLFAFSSPVWIRKLSNENEMNTRVIEARAMIPVLAAQNAVFICDYWDAYLLAFMSRGAIQAEPFPWQLVRRYGAISEKDMSRKNIWIIPEGEGSDVWRKITDEIGKPSTKLELPVMMFGKYRYITEFKDYGIAPELMRRYQPKYFGFKYPPGS